MKNENDDRDDFKYLMEKYEEYKKELKNDNKEYNAEIKKWITIISIIISVLSLLGVFVYIPQYITEFFSDSVLMICK